jgi:hypothetical protein
MNSYNDPNAGGNQQQAPQQQATTSPPSANANEAMVKDL